MFKKNKIIIELDKRYFDRNALWDAVVQKLKNQGKECKFIEDDFLLIDGKKYALIEKNIPVRFAPPVQQAILKEINE